MLKRFRLEEPGSVREASELLAQFGDAAKLYAGGTELLLAMKEGLVHYERLVNVKTVPGLKEIKAENGIVRIGALATHHEIETSPLVRERLPAFAKLERNVANVRVREAGTIGGNLCFAEPHADPGTLLLVLEAQLVAAKAAGTRRIPAEAFFVDAYETSLEPDEVLTEIHIPVPTERSGVSYMKFGYLERPSVGVAVKLSLDGGAVQNVGIAVGCAGPAPRRVKEAEELLRGKTPDEALQLLPDAGRTAAKAAQAISDLHGSQEYKEHIVGVLLRRCFQDALNQCR
ncbi:MAG TPA: xanthine dehydrogenase family protein subunit M [Candidatus Eisenbacteria bacterium]|nr:xanthine dehydrogenase family protein subunit M [Candidatus Eisenbacteria bacterium]